MARGWCILLQNRLFMTPSSFKTRVTLSDVARKLNVSHTTVSRALRNDRRISKSLSRRIQRTAQEMGYRPDAMLSALAHYRRTSKAVPIAAEIAWINHYPDPEQLRSIREFDLYWKGAVSEAEMNGYRLEEFRLDKDMPPRRLERVLLARNSLGILIPPSRHGEYPDWGDFHWENFYVVRFGQQNLSPRVHQVLADQLNDAVLAYVNILKKGYQRVGLVTTAVRGTRLRFLAGYLYAQAQDAKNRPLPPLLFAEPTGQDNLSKLVAWLKNSKPDAILTDYAPVRDMLARAGYRVPEDVGLAATSVVDGYADAGIYQNSDEIGRAAVQLLISLIHHNQRGSPRVCRKILVEGDWVDGKSLPPRNVHCQRPTK
jgi:DNA-binding LacI/PurR family transcriptional regulator